MLGPYIDARKGIEVVVEDVYPRVEHRECMRHLWKDIKKSYIGDIHGKNMWFVAKSFTISKFNYFTRKIEEKDPKAIEWLDQNHPYMWSRSKFSEDYRVDYINNNLFETFNSWVSKTKNF
jgi:hypothetical protein